MHFSLIVIGENVEKRMIPFREYESSGIEDEYVTNIDITKEMRKEYEEACYNEFFDENDNIIDPINKELYRNPTTEEIESFRKSRKSSVYPVIVDGKCFWSSFWDSTDNFGGMKVLDTSSQIKIKKVYLKESISFEQYLKQERGVNIQDKDLAMFSFYTLDENGEIDQVIQKTNPNAQWDWYEIGGRWGNFFLTRDGIRSNSAIKSSIDFFAKRDRCLAEMMPTFYKVKEIVGDRPLLDLADYNLPEESIANAWNKYIEDPVIIDLKAEFGPNFFYGRIKEEFCSLDEDAYKRKIAMESIVVRAFLDIDGIWHEKGNNQSQEEWEESLLDLIEKVPEDANMTIVDCHI